MAEPGGAGSKLGATERIGVSRAELRATALRIFAACGCDADEAAEVADHLIEADRCGVESHGTVRILQYAREYRSGSLTPGAPLDITEDAPNRLRLNAHGGIGIRALRQTVDAAATRARRHGLALATLTGAGHTGRLGAFAETAAEAGCLTITLGGGDRKRWRMVAPYGGRQALLPTNPYCIGIPGGARGPVVVDFATGKVAGGWIYAARAAGTDLPPGMIIDRHGLPATRPETYFDGGAILPKGGPLGFGLALVAELVGEAMLGPVDRGEINWMVLAVDCTAHAAPDTMRAAAEEILAEIRACPPLAGGPRVEIPGERERDRAAAATGIVHLPRPIWQQIRALDPAGAGQA